MSKQEQEVIEQQGWIAQAFADNPNQVFDLNPDDPNELLIRPERNSRGHTPEVGDKSLAGLIERIESIGQTTPCFATLAAGGVADIYAGFRRARAIQTMRQNGNPGMLLRVLITPFQLTDFEIYERSLSENVDRENLSPMQRVNALLELTEAPNSLPLSQACKRLNMSKGSASTYLRFAQFPAVAKKALDAGKLTYDAAEKLIKLLPKSDEVKAMTPEEATAALEKAQERIAGYVTKKLVAGGKVGGRDADKATREAKASDGKGPVNKTQRRPKLIVTELEEVIEKQKAIDTKAAQQQAAVLTAIIKYVNGGSLRTLLKAIEG